MARANALTLGLLNQYPELLHEDVWRFNQVLGEGARQSPSSQNQPYIQFEREYIARALADAAVKAAEYLGYWPAPQWVQAETVTLDSDLRWNGQTLQTRFGHLIGFGKRATSLITAAVAVAYSDTDDDGVDDTATITVSGVNAVAADEITVFFRPADGAPSAADERWAIEPLTVSKSGDNATISGHRALFAHPKKVWAKEYTSDYATQKHAGNTGSADDFVTHVDVYRVVADSTAAVELLTHDSASPVTPASATVTHPEQGHFRLYSGPAQSLPTGRPYAVRVWYRAGYALSNGRMDDELALALTRYANTIMPQQPNMTERALAMWHEDRKVDNLSERDTWSPPPFGITAGGLYCWSVIAARRNELKGKPTKRRA